MVKTEKAWIDEEENNQRKHISEDEDRSRFPTGPLYPAAPRAEPQEEPMGASRPYARGRLWLPGA